MASVLLLCGQVFLAMFTCGCNESPGLNGIHATGTVRLYTSVPEASVQVIKDRFETECPGVSLEVYRAGTGPVISRIEQEAAAGEVQADVVWMADFSAAEALKEQGLLLSYSSPAAVDIPPMLLDSEAYYSGSRLIIMVVGYNTDLVPEAPGSYRDLLKPEYAGRIGLASPDNSGASFYTVGTLILDPGYGWEYLYNLHYNKCRVLDDNQQVAEQLASGELALGLVPDYAIRELRRQNPGVPLQYVFFPDGVISIVSPVAIMRDCRDLEAAQLFVDWLLSPQGQSLLVEETSTMTVNTRVEPAAGMLRLQDIRVIPSNPQAVYRNSGNISRIYHDIFAGKPVEEIDATLDH